MSDYTTTQIGGCTVTVLNRPITAPLVPASVTMRQARLALLAAGKLTAVDTAIASLSEPEKSKALIAWDYSNVVERNEAFVAMLAPALGLDSAGLDALFTAAAAL